MDYQDLLLKPRDEEWTVPRFKALVDGVVLPLVWKGLIQESESSIAKEAIEDLVDDYPVLNTEEQRSELIARVLGSEKPNGRALGLRDAALNAVLLKRYAG